LHGDRAARDERDGPCRAADSCLVDDDSRALPQVERAAVGEHDVGFPEELDLSSGRVEIRAEVDRAEVHEVLADPEYVGGLQSGFGGAEGSTGIDRDVGGDVQDPCSRVFVLQGAAVGDGEVERGGGCVDRDRAAVRNDDVVGHGRLDSTRPGKA
jgi:hypothetical protein